MKAGKQKSEIRKQPTQQEIKRREIAQRIAAQLFDDPAAEVNAITKIERELSKWLLARAPKRGSR